MMQDFVFVDTSVFIAENYWGKKLQSLFDLASRGVIKLILPEIIQKEILFHLNKSIENEYANITRLRTGILKHCEDVKDKLDNLPNKSDIGIAVINNFERQFLTTTEIIKTPTNFDLNTILNKYFEGEYPFSEKKKAEFPDAIALQLLEDWCKSNECKCICLSRDGDLMKFNSKRIIYQDYTTYINEKLKEEAAIVAEAIKYAEDNDSIIKQEIENWLNDNLDNDVLYCTYLMVENIHDYTIDNIYIDDDFEYTVASVSNDDVYLEAKAHVWIRVEVSHPDYDSGYYDREDNRWYFINESMDQVVEKELYIPISILFSKDDEKLQIDISEINKGKRLLRI